MAQTTFGGDTNEYIALAPVENYAEADKGPPLLRAGGPELMNRIAAKMAGVVLSQVRTTMRPVPEFSYP